MNPEEIFIVESAHLGCSDACKEECIGAEVILINIEQENETYRFLTGENKGENCRTLKEHGKVRKKCELARE